MQVRDEVLLTDAFERVEELSPKRPFLYVCGCIPEHRVAVDWPWEHDGGSGTVARVICQEPHEIEISVTGVPNRRIPLRSSAGLSGFFKDHDAEHVYIDITGLSHHVWAPLLRVSFQLRRRVVVTYVEPKEYKFSASPTEGDIFDLSERITGVAPLPGFASLRDVTDDKTCFVPLLGFEGTRFAHILEHVQVPAKKVFPIIGAPGFRLEYPFFTFLGNQPTLSRTKTWRNVQFAPANDPFSLFYVLQDIMQLNPGERLKVAPIGTKPHALGAILFALAHGDLVEIVYDHPIRKADRTDGVKQMLSFQVSSFLGA